MKQINVAIASLTHAHVRKYYQTLHDNAKLNWVAVSCATEAVAEDFKYAAANGIYRKVDGKVYGIIRVLWYYKAPAPNKGFIMDDTYFLYGEDGTGREVTRDELREVIGDDAFIMSFPYGDGIYVIYEF